VSSLSDLMKLSSSWSLCLLSENFVLEENHNFYESKTVKSLLKTNLKHDLLFHWNIYQQLFLNLWVHVFYEMKNLNLNHKLKKFKKDLYFHIILEEKFWRKFIRSRCINYIFPFEIILNFFIFYQIIYETFDLMSNTR
jgi:hypothetical protein